MRPILRQTAFTALAALSAASIAAPAAWAQDDPRGQQPAPDQMRARMRQMHEAHQRQRAADLRIILHLRPDQEPALTAFLQAHGRPEGAGKMGEHRQAPAAMTTPQRLDEMASREAAHEAMQKRRAEALRAFYAALSPEQRQVFDALQRMQGRHDGRDRHAFGGMRGPMGGPGRPLPPHGE
ncbi:MAG TPA: Spy/CpxP family protein refolding chaperone [Phenylobacterium sp.]|nr:Spy/CpxP family protein refolding chaperone [Phenylobacterium sp.]